MGKGGSAPEADPRIGEAAILSARTGQEMLDWTRKQAGVSNLWAQQDRERYMRRFRPVEDKFVRLSENYDTLNRQRAESERAMAGVRKQSGISRQINARQQAAMGVDPRSGRAAAGQGEVALSEGLAAVGGGNAARGAVEAEGRRRLGEVINMGSSLPGAAAGGVAQATATGASGFQGAMAGYGQQGQLLNQQYNQQMQAYQAQQQGQAGLMGGLGMLGGALIQNPGILASFSSKDYKENKRPTRGALRALEKMPVEDWDYKPGMGDGGSHTGPYAEDFKAATGKGNGKVIPIVDQIGVTMGAVKELSKKVDKLAKTRGAIRAAA